MDVCGGPAFQHSAYYTDTALKPAILNIRFRIGTTLSGGHGATRS